jgi:uncharacterized C2H2 Zn-finger protein
MTPEEEKYQFIDGKTYRCLSCGHITNDRLNHVNEAEHYSFKVAKK